MSSIASRAGRTVDTSRLLAASAHASPITRPRSCRHLLSALFEHVTQGRGKRQVRHATDKTFELPRATDETMDFARPHELRIDHDLDVPAGGFLQHRHDFA